jgi:hypothetical protein
MRPHARVIQRLNRAGSLTAPQKQGSVARVNKLVRTHLHSRLLGFVQQHARQHLRHNQREREDVDSLAPARALAALLGSLVRLGAAIRSQRVLCVGGANSARQAKLAQLPTEEESSDVGSASQAQQQM